MQQRRKNYLINKNFQFSFTSKFVALIVLESLLIMAWFFYISNDTVTTGYFNSILTVETTRHFFSTKFILLTLIVAVGVALAGMVVFILLSHRLAGPQYRFQMTLKKLQEGDLRGDVNLRKKDQFNEVQEELNNLIRSLDTRLGTIKKDLNDLDYLLKQKQDAATAQKMQIKIQQLRQSMDHFKLTQDSTNA